MQHSVAVGHKAAASELTSKKFEARSLVKRAGLVNSRSAVDLDHRAPRSHGAAKEKAKVGEPARYWSDQTASATVRRIESVVNRAGHVSFDLRSIALWS